VSEKPNKSAPFCCCSCCSRLLLFLLLLLYLLQKIFYDIEYHYDIILEKLNLQTLHIRRRHIDALFLINAFCGTKYCPSVLETVGLRVPTRNIRNFTTFSCSFSHCPSARSAANAVCKSIDIFSKSRLSLNSLS
jgi:hypothetical protein